MPVHLSAEPGLPFSTQCGGSWPPPHAPVPTSSWATAQGRRTKRQRAINAGTEGWLEETHWPLCSLGLAAALPGHMVLEFLPKREPRAHAEASALHLLPLRPSGRPTTPEHVSMDQDDLGLSLVVREPSQQRLMTVRHTGQTSWDWGHSAPSWSLWGPWTTPLMSATACLATR